MSAAARLCAACGMCCNGVLFHGVRLQAGESARPLTVRGLKVKRDLLVQPCAAHHVDHCAIYDLRPARCRRFACRQLQAVLDGALAENNAMERISEAHALVNRVLSLLRTAGDEREHKALAVRCESFLSPPFDPSPEAREFRELLSRSLEELEDFLREHFRCDHND